MNILTSLLKLIYWFILILIFYDFFGYPLLLGFLCLFKKKTKQERPEYLPKVSLVILAGNDQKTIGQKLDSTVFFEYPKAKLEVIVATVNSTDNTRKIVEDYFTKGVKLLYQAEKTGRIPAINACAAQAVGEVIIFTDGVSVIEKFSIKNLVRHFVDAKVGLVAGNIDYLNRNNDLVLGEKLFITHNRAILNNSSKLKKISRVNPELYAVRKADFHKLSDDGILDSTSMPVMYSVSGKVCLFEPLALAVKTLNTNTDDYFTGRVNLAIESLRTAKYIKELFHSKKYLTLIQLLSNNILSGLSGVLLFLLFIFNLTVLVKPGYVVLLSLQFLFYVAGALKLFGFFPYYMLFTSYADITGLIKFLKEKGKNGKS